MIPRLIEKSIVESLKSLKKIILILGARQVGKTTLIKGIQEKLQAQGQKTLYLNCDINEDLFSVDTSSKLILQRLLSGIDVLIIDEAQRLSNPGLTLKIIHDNFPGTKVIATGSSSFELKNKMSDPLTGRYVDFMLYPFSMSEIFKEEEKPVFLLPSLMVYGFYPGIYLENKPHNKQLFLTKIIESYLFKDILSFQTVRNPQAIKDLTKALAYQVGSEVNENELATRLKIDRKTVVSYLDILEKAYVIFRLYPFSKNPRREIGKNYKIYFIDLGIRNALIGDFNPINLRADLGSLWENFLFIERVKMNINANQLASYYFWRSYGGAEVDFIEQIGSKMQAFEFKYGGNSLSKGAHSFIKEYQIKASIVNKNNFTDFINH